MTDLHAYFHAFEKLSILVLGDVMLDRYLSGQVERISPEAPVPVMHLRQEENRLGGAANVALNLRAMGAIPYLCSVVGQDGNGDTFLNLLPQHQLSAAGISRSRERCTTVKTRILAQNQQLLRVDREDLQDLSAEEESDLLALIQQILDEENIDLILFQDYNKGVLTSSLIQEIIAEAHARAIPTAVDPKKANFWAYRNTTLFKPNLREIQQQVDFRVTPDLATLDRATAVIRERLSNLYTMITLSDRGLYLHDGQQGIIVPTQARSIADVSGAGDTVISVAALALAAGMPTSWLAHLANAAGGQVVEKPGVVPVDREALLRFFRQ